MPIGVVGMAAFFMPGPTQACERGSRRGEADRMRSSRPRRRDMRGGGVASQTRPARHPLVPAWQAN